MNYQNLAQAIVLQAVKDYRKASKALQADKDNKGAQWEKDAIEDFFRSKWYTVLTKVDGEMLIRKLQEEVQW